MSTAIQARSLRQTKVELEKLDAFVDCLKSLLPEDLAETFFGDFDRHMGFIGYYIERRVFDWIESNFHDLEKNDFPYIKREIYSFLEKEKLPEKKVAPLSKNVFIVHGKDRKSVKELKLMLKELGLNPIVLHELPSGSMTIIEKLEKFSENVGFAFAILTPDDVGFKLNRFLSLLRTGTFEHDQKKWFLEETITHELKPRARQNVLLEFGFFMGKLSRSKVCCLYKGNVDLPSDMHGIVYVHFNNSVKECRDKIIKELKAVGYEIRA